MRKALHLSGDIDKLCMSRKGERGLANIEDSIYKMIRRLKDYRKKSKEILTAATRINTNDIRINRRATTRKQK